MNVKKQIIDFSQQLDEISELVDTAVDASANADRARTQLERLRDQMKSFAEACPDPNAVQAVKGALSYLPKLSSKPSPIWSSKISGAQIDLKHFLTSCE